MYRSFKYKGLIIYENFKGKFGSKYYSVVNPRKYNKEGNLVHIHSGNKGQAIKIANCFHNMKKGKSLRKYNLNTRNKAMTLGGSEVKMMY